MQPKTVGAWCDDAWIESAPFAGCYQKILNIFLGPQQEMHHQCTRKQLPKTLTCDLCMHKKSAKKMFLKMRLLFLPLASFSTNAEWILPRAALSTTRDAIE
ncbi:hypothetical protein N9L76_01405 [bacterium]|nr:hypothetical protein [bacterium]